MTEIADDSDDIKVEVVSVEPRQFEKIEKPMSKMIADAVVELLRDNKNYLHEALASSPDGKEGFVERLNNLIAELEGDDKAFLEAARDNL